MTALFTFAALALDWILGAPQSWPHPTRLLGRLIVRSERVLLAAGRRRGSGALLSAGGVLAFGVPVLSGLAAWLSLSWLGGLTSFLWLAIALYLCYSALCLRDLLDHAEAVEKALERGDLTAARGALSLIVGRDVAELDEAAVRRAVVETLAENFSDGLAAPLMALALGGPVLVWIYKAINTLDSMVGYKNERYQLFGRCSAKLDDAANYIPSRLAALILIVAARIEGLDWRSARRLRRSDGRLHPSPNSAQTEAAAAGALGVFLGGPSSYGGELSNKPVINVGGAATTAATVTKAKRLIMTGTFLTAGLAALVELLIQAAFGRPWGWGLPF